MIETKEIGGYIELEHYTGEMLHSDGILLNCGRSCLAYLILTRKIQKIILPYFMCDSVENLCIKHGISIRHYHTDTHFLPVDVVVDDDEWLYLMDYYGQFSDKFIHEICRTHHHVILDLAQNYFREPVEGIDTFYTCRKFFGVPDGGILYSDAPKLNRVIPMDESFERMHFLLGRFERSASEFYQEYVDNNAFFSNEPIRQMSLLTRNLLSGIDYEHIKERRTKNFSQLHGALGVKNELDIHTVEGAFAYPLLVKNGSEIRRKLIEQKIYVPTLWPNVMEALPPESLEYYMASNILPLPCDQRYSEEDMNRIIHCLGELL